MLLVMLISQILSFEQNLLKMFGLSIETLFFIKTKVQQHLNPVVLGTLADRLFLIVTHNSQLITQLKTPNH